jgi:hypothetical protein
MRDSKDDEKEDFEPYFLLQLVTPNLEPKENRFV